MPHSNLPIIISRNDYIELSSEIVENNMIAIVQPLPAFSRNRKRSPDDAFKTGCAGKITDINFLENEVNINIYGVCRFDIVSYIDSAESIERVFVNYERYCIDIEENRIDADELNTEKLMKALDIYFRNLEISPNWKEIQKTPAAILVSALAMACPFHPSERQSILEVVDIKERSEMITKIIEMNSFNQYNTVRTLN